MSDVFDGMLLDDETTIWSGKPDWTRADKTSRTGERIRAVIGFLIAAGAFFALLIMGLWIPLNGFLGMLAILGMVVFVIIGLIAIGIGYHTIDRKKSVEHYLLTSHRLIRISQSDRTQTDIIKGFAAAIHCRPNGEMFDVYVGLASDVEPAPLYDSSVFSIVLQAVEDGPAIKKLILETLMPE